MDVSIVIVNYNTLKATDDCIKSCLADRSRLTCEIIVVDNASTDGSYEYLSKKYKSVSNVKFLKNDGNLGFSKGVNTGLRISKGNYKFLLNSDTTIHKGTLESLIEFCKLENNIGIVGTKLRLPDSTIQKSCYNLPTIGNALREYVFGCEHSFSGYAPQENEAVEVESIVGASFLITPKAYKNVGLFDERYFMYFEDMDYCRRTRKCGLKIFYLPNIIVEHHHGLSGKNLASTTDQWKRLIPSSKIYHGHFRHFIINTIIWLSQKWKILLKV